ncbi:MAG TPA: hypothetical protein VF587_14145, partial [Solirubrobacteraceae bacterium]
HAEAAAFLESVAGDRREEFAELLAHHLEAAATDAALAWPDDDARREEIRSRAVAALVEAGHIVYRRLALEQTQRFGERALALAANDQERVFGVELKAHANHAALRSDESFGFYLEAIDLARACGDVDSETRLRSEATLLCVRYGGAFKTPGWGGRAAAMVQQGLAGVDEHEDTPEAAALLLARAVGLPAWGAGETDPVAARRDALRAVAIAERLEFNELLARALETLGSIVFGQGLCEAEAMGERLIAVADRAPGRVELHETLVVAAMCLARAGRFDRARGLVRDSTEQAGRLGPHRALHAAGAATLALVPSGDLDAFGAATESVARDAAEDTNGVCSSVALALAGRALWLHENGDSAAGARLAAMVESGRATPRPSPDPLHCIELMRPLLGVEETRERLRSVPPRKDATMDVHRLRAGLQVHAVAGDWAEVDRMVAAADALATAACAPVLGFLAQWARAMRSAADGRPDEAVAAATTATDGLAAFGERYTAARVLADLVPLLDGPARDELAETAAARLEAVGARTAAANLG